jgi:hypothetical protein
MKTPSDLSEAWIASPSPFYRPALLTPPAAGVHITMTDVEQPQGLQFLLTSSEKGREPHRRSFPGKP